MFSLSTALDLEKSKKHSYQLFAVVISLHLLFFALIGYFESAHKKPPQSTKLAVRTVLLTPTPITTSSKKAAPQKELPPIQEPVVAINDLPEVTLPSPEEAAPAPQKKPTPSKPTPASKPVVQKSIAKPISKPVSKPALKAPPKPQVATAQAKIKEQKQKEAANETRVKKQQEEIKKNALVQDALASLERAGSSHKKIGSTSSTSSKAVSAPKQIGSLASDALVTLDPAEEVLVGREKCYYDELIQRLKLHLRLPDYGYVKIKLTLNKQGKVLKLECLNAKSAKNKAHLEKVLPSLVFPSFGQNFPKEEQHTFSIHFCNELSY
jgi:hypothetical protein